MAKILIGSNPIAGHVTPTVPVVKKLIERGHEVVWYTGKKYQAKVEKSGAKFVPITGAIDYDDEDMEAAFPDLKGINGMKRLKLEIKKIFIDPVPGHIGDMQKILTEFPADVIIAESTFVAPYNLRRLQTEKTKWIALGIMPLDVTSIDTAPTGLGLPPNSSFFGRIRNRFLNWLSQKVLFAEVSKYGNDLIQAKLGLPPTNFSLFDVSKQADSYLQLTVPSFEYPRSDLPANIRFIGANLGDPLPDFVPPAWWDRLKAGKPIIHVTQGTISGNFGELLKPTIEVLRNEDVFVVATTGNLPVESVGITNLPENTVLERFIPHFHLLPHVDVLVTNAGYGGVHMALANGVPIVAAGVNQDKIEVSARVAYSGAGVNLKTQTPKPEKIKKAVFEILSNPQYRQKAKQLQAEFANYNAMQTIAETAEALAGSTKVSV
jgi:UDP:flavonoid glycosyltransferase YjiC (YdhE family)